MTAAKSTLELPLPSSKQASDGGQLEHWLAAACMAAEEMARGLGLCCVVLGRSDGRMIADDLSPAAYVPVIGEDISVQIGVIVEHTTCGAFASACAGTTMNEATPLDEVADIVGEVANTLAGEVHQQMQHDGVVATVGLPFFVRGRAWISVSGLEVSAYVQFGPSRICLVIMRTRGEDRAERGEVRDKARLLEMAIESRKAAEAYNRELIANAPYGIVTIDARGLIVSWNPTAERIFGYGGTEKMGQQISSLIASPNPAIDQDLFSPLVLPRIIGKRHDLLGLHKDGRKVPIEVHIIATTRDGRSTFTAFIKDLTDIKRAEKEVHELNSELMSVSRRAGMAEVAGEVLHNVGNVLNSVFVTTRVIREQLRTSRVPILSRLSALFDEQGVDVSSFIANDPRGQQVPKLIHELSLNLSDEHRKVSVEIETLNGHIEHIAAVISAQRRHVGSSGVYEAAAVASIVESAIEVLAHKIRSYHIDVVRNFEAIAPFALDKHRVLQILINLLKNGIEAVIEAKQERPRLTIAVARGSEGQCSIAVSDNGIGIGQAEMRKVFSYGFTTKSYGTGYGLHASANAAKEMGGELVCHSEGMLCGATFKLTLPLKPGQPIHTSKSLV